MILSLVEYAQDAILMKKCSKDFFNKCVISARGQVYLEHRLWEWIVLL
jgi:hypothetical protein